METKQRPLQESMGQVHGGKREWETDSDVWSEGPDTCIGNHTTRIYLEKPMRAGMTMEWNQLLPPLKRSVPAHALA